MFKALFGKGPKIVDLANLNGRNSDQYQRFCGAYPILQKQVNSEAVLYYDSGEDKPVMVLLPGSIIKAESWFLYFQALRKKFRVIIPEIKNTQSLNKYCSQLEGLLDGLDIEKASVLGQAFGGALAQSFADEYPNRVNHLIVLGGFSNTDEVADKTRKNYKRSLTRLLKALDDIAFNKMQRTLYKQVTKGVEVAFVEDKGYWKAFYGNLLLETLESELRDMNHLQVDYWNQVQTKKPCVQAVLIIDTKTELDYDRQEKKALLNRFSEYDPIVLEGSGNMFQIREMEKIIDHIEKAVLT